MKVNNLLKIVFALIITFLFNVSVFAFNNETGVIQQYGSELNYNGKLKFHLKFYDTGDMEPVVFCTQFSRITPAGKDKVCSLNNSWSKAVSVGVASIIEKVGKVTAAATDISAEKYYYGEIAINEFLCNSGVDTEYTCIHNREDINVTTAQELLGDYYSWYTDAISIRNAYNQASLAFSISKLTFEKDGNDYVSNKFQITQKSFDGINVSVNLQGSIGELKKEGDNYYVVVPVTSVQEGSSIDVIVNASVSKKVSVAQNYNCGLDYQDITPNILEEDVLSKSTSISGTIKADVERGSLEITKIDSETKEKLSGVLFELYSGDNCSGVVVLASRTTDKGIVVFDSLPFGKYSYKEKETAEGYEINSTCKTVNISSTERVKETMSNKKKIINKIEIIKVNAKDEKVLSGAKLHIEDEKGNIIKEWVTDDKPYVVEGLEYGIYYVVEDSAPTGYVLNKEKTKFVVDENTDNLEIEIKNKLITLEISKISAVDNKELKGATLQILDKDKNKISCTIIKTEKENEKLEECTWVSEDKPKTIIGLLPGKYYLKEIIAPEGYVLNEEMVEFEIKEDGTSEPVVMKNELEVEVPNTLSSRSTLLIAISMFDIALGIGILTYVKKHKIEE